MYMGQRMRGAIESSYICSLLLEVRCALKVGLGKRTCFSRCVELKGETGCREYRLQIKGSDNAAFFEGQRNAESKLNTAICKCHTMYVGVTLECCRGKACVCIPFWMEYCLLQQSSCPAPIVLVMS